jgi:hypothetical protein
MMAQLAYYRLDWEAEFLHRCAAGAGHWTRAHAVLSERIAPRLFLRGRRRQLKEALERITPHHQAIDRCDIPHPCPGPNMDRALGDMCGKAVLFLIHNGNPTLTGADRE